MTAVVTGFDYDVIVVGSGFGGSVAALRLSEKGYRVAVLEAGRRFDATTLPATSWDLQRFLWAPRIGCFGIQRVHLLRDVVVLAGAGVGGGSLNYANTLYEPPSTFFEDSQWTGPGWGGEVGWRSLLVPHYAQARRMLGATDYSWSSPADEAMEKVATAMGAGASFCPASVGVFFGHPGMPPGSLSQDPYFGGAGPSRRSCVHCGECMTGCRWGAKNTLSTNYLYLAERAGAVIMPLTTVVSLQPGQKRAGPASSTPSENEPGDAPDGSSGWCVDTVASTRLWRGARSGRGRAFSAEHVILAAGAYGTQKLLHTMARTHKLPLLSPRLGQLSRTNSESLLGAVVPRGRPHPDFSRGVAITSSFSPEPGTRVEPVRYGHRSNLMGLLGALLVDGPGGPGGRQSSAVSRFVAEAVRHPRDFLGCFDVRRWSERTVIALVMQARDNSLTVFARPGPLGGLHLSSRQGEGEPNPSWLPVGHEVARRLAGVTGARPVGNLGEVFGLPITAHFLGGCVIGCSPEEGVVDPWHRVYGYGGLHIVDGSAVPANPGVNPALTITALAERAFSHWPNRGDPDPRPPVGLRTGAGEVSALAEVVRATPPVPARWPVAPAAGPTAAPAEGRRGPGRGPDRVT